MNIDNIDDIRVAQVDLMKRFDFERVHRVMQFLNWGWSDGRVPTLDQLRNKANDLLNEIIERWQQTGKNQGISTGGFTVSLEIVEDQPRLELLFYVDCRTVWFTPTGMSRI